MLKNNVIAVEAGPLRGMAGKGGKSKGSADLFSSLIGSLSLDLSSDPGVTSLGGAKKKADLPLQQSPSSDADRHYAGGEQILESLQAQGVVLAAVDGVGFAVAKEDSKAAVTGPAQLDAAAASVVAQNLATQDLTGGGAQVHALKRREPTPSGASFAFSDPHSEADGSPDTSQVKLLADDGDGLKISDQELDPQDLSDSRRDFSLVMSSSRGALTHAADIKTSAATTPQRVDVPFANQAAWTQAMNQRVLFMMRDGISEASISISPEALGPVDVKVRMDAGAVNVEFSSPYQEVRDAISSGVDSLDSSLSEGGIHLAKVEVKDSLETLLQDKGRDNQSQNRGGSSQQDQAKRQGGNSSFSFSAEEDEES